MEGDNSKLTESRIDALRVSIRELLFRGKDEILYGSISAKVQKVVIELELFIQVERAALSLSEANLSSALMAFEQFLGSVENRKRELFYLLDVR